MLLKSKGFRDYIKQNTPELGKRKSACLHETWSLGRTLTSDDIAPRVFMGELLLTHTHISIYGALLP